MADSRANFVTVNLGKKLDIDAFRKKALSQGFLLRRPFREDFLREWVRIGLLEKKDMEKFIELIKEFFIKEER